MSKWYGKRKRPHFGETIALGRQGNPKSLKNLISLSKDSLFPGIVRIQAALGVASIKNLQLTKDQERVFETVTKEYISVMEYSGNFPSGRYNLALMYHSLWQTDKAIENYEESIKIDSLFFPAQNNLAMLYNAKNENEKAEKLFMQIIETHPQMYDIAYSFGLLLVEEKNTIRLSFIFKEQAAVCRDGQESSIIWDCCSSS